MKTPIITIGLIVAFFSSCALAEAPVNGRNKQLIHQLKGRISELEANMDSHMQVINEKQEAQYHYIDQRFERLEQKFDRYFMWGYGLMITLMLGMAGMLRHSFKVRDG